MVAFFGAALAGIVVGCLVGQVTRFERGVAVGCLIVALGGLGGAARLAFANWEALRGAETATGELVRFVTQRLERTGKSGSGGADTVRVPVVRFTALDGRSYEITGLGGSQSQLWPGDKVQVIYSPDDPEKGRIDDFQNRWGGVWALGLFGGFPLLAGLFFLFQSASPDGASDRAARPGRKASARASRDRARDRRAAPPSAFARWRTAYGRRILRAVVPISLLVMTGGLFLCGLYPGDNPAQGFGAGFMTVGAGAALLGIGTALDPGQGWQSPFICFILAIMFAAFGAGIFML